MHRFSEEKRRRKVHLPSPPYLMLYHPSPLDSRTPSTPQSHAKVPGWSSGKATKQGLSQKREEE